MFEQFILGVIQGITEWLPVSSSGVIAIVKNSFFAAHEGIEAISKESLSLHLGTFLAALIYLRRDVVLLVKNLFHYRRAGAEKRNVLAFLAISTVVSGLLGFALIKLFAEVEKQLELPGRVATGIIGVLLLITACAQLKTRGGGHKDFKDLKFADGMILGLAQGFAALPGLSRSGLTVAALLLRKFDKACALKLSFLMSLPVVLAGNIILNLNAPAWSAESLVGLFVSFVFGLATIHLLLKLAGKINFGYFVLFFGILTILSAAV